MSELITASDRRDDSHRDEHEAASQQPTYRPRVSAPRSVWLELVLGLVTCNLYFCFWMVARANDLKHMRSNHFQPWLWFFAPIIGIAQYIAFPIMFSELKLIEQDRLHRAWHRWWGLWLVALIAVSILGVSPEFGLAPEWVFWASIVLFTGLMLMVHARFNSLKRHDQHLLIFEGKKACYAWWEWLILSLACAVWALLGYLAWQENKSVIASLPATYVHESSSPPLKFEVNGKRWRRVEIGSFSDGSALVEFADSAQTAYLLVFQHGANDTLDSVATFRFQDMQDDFPGKPKCAELRELAKDEKSVVSLSTCERDELLVKAFSASKLIMIEGRIYELLGFTKTDQASLYRSNESTINNAMATFSRTVVNKGAKQ